ncbi:MAG: sugar phosphate nucleotidyltransferase [bacterium]
MKAVIPAAGIGKRLRPHTLNKPKALLPVAGKPIIGHIVDDLCAAGIDELVIIIGYMGAAVRKWFAAAGPDVPVTFVVQRERLGLGHAIWTARDALGDEPFFCILGDTILKADYSALVHGETNLIGVCAVDDPRRFGVVDTDRDCITAFVEKPDVPPTNLAIVGAYLFRDGAELWRSLDHLINQDIRTKGEYQLTDALQLMVNAGIPFTAVPVDGWYDCGKPETWLETNRVLLDKAERTGASPGVTAPCAVAPDATLVESRIGPHVTIGSGTTITHCELADCVIGAGSHLENCRLTGSLIGERCQVNNVVGQVNVGDFAELRL